MILKKFGSSTRWRVNLKVFTSISSVSIKVFLTTDSTIGFVRPQENSPGTDGIPSVDEAPVKESTSKVVKEKGDIMILI